jgi:hypothetical protein
VIRRPDSLPYVGAADSTGQFAVGPLDEGTYTVRALLDGNRNRAIDPGEAWDSVSIIVRGSSPFLELLAAQRDTIAPRLLTVTASDSLSISVSFDRPVDPSVRLTPASFRVQRADSTPVRVVAVLTRELLDSLLKIARDSIARLDTTARRDTVARRDTAPPVRVPPPPAPVPAVPPLPKPSRPPPRRDYIVRVDPLTPLQPGTSYRVTALDIRGLMGHTRSSDRVLQVPMPRRDTTQSRAPVRPPARPPLRSQSGSGGE